MFISYDPDPDIARSSPGELLLCAVLRDACARNLSAFDLGVGDARYKTTFCDESERLAEALYAPTWAGRLAAPFFAARFGRKSRDQAQPAPVHAGKKGERLLTSRRRRAVRPGGPESAQCGIDRGGEALYFPSRP